MATFITYRQKILLGDRDPLVMLRGTRQSGLPFFAYVILSMEQLAKLNYDMENGRMVQLGEYGKVIMQGEGEPNDDQKYYMERHYAFDHFDPFADDVEPIAA